MLARNPRQGLTDKQQQLLKDLHFTSNGLDVDKLTEDQKMALIAAIPLGAQVCGLMAVTNNSLQTARKFELDPLC